MSKSRRRLLTLLVALPLATGFLSTASTARADTYGLCWQAGCNGLDPIAERCDQGVTTISSITYSYSDGSRYEVDLRYSTECEANWARVVTSTAQRFCIKNSNGNVDRYISAPNIASWTNMINGAPNVHDEAYLALPAPTEALGENVLWASDQPSYAPAAGEAFTYPC